MLKALKELQRLVCTIFFSKLDQKVLKGSVIMIARLCLRNYIKIIKCGKEYNLL